MDANLVYGGTPQYSFPNCDGSSLFYAPWMKTVAHEYATGYFTLGKSLKPGRDQRYQLTELEKTQPTVDDHIWLMAVPQKHLLRSVLLEVVEADANMAGAALAPSALLYDNANDTFVESPVLDGLFANTALDVESCEWAPVPGGTSSITFPETTLTSTGGGQSDYVGDTITTTNGDDSVVIPNQTLTGTGGEISVIPETTLTGMSNGAFFVPAGNTLILTLKVVADPTDTSLSIANMKAWVKYVAKVEGFECPDMN